MGKQCGMVHVSAALSGSLAAAAHSGSEGSSTAALCQMCGKKYVPEVLLATCEVPEAMPVAGSPQLLEVRICRAKKKDDGEGLAQSVSVALPILEYQIHMQLMHKMKIHALNAAFGLRVDLVCGDNHIIAIATATAFRCPALPLPTAPVQIQTGPSSTPVAGSGSALAVVPQSSSGGGGPGGGLGGGSSAQGRMITPSPKGIPSPTNRQQQQHHARHFSLQDQIRSIQEAAQEFHRASSGDSEPPIIPRTSESELALPTSSFADDPNQQQQLQHQSFTRQTPRSDTKFSSLLANLELTEKPAGTATVHQLNLPVSAGGMGSNAESGLASSHAAGSPEEDPNVKEKELHRKISQLLAAQSSSAGPESDSSSSDSSSSSESSSSSSSGDDSDNNTRRSASIANRSSRRREKDGPGQFVIDIEEDEVDTLVGLVEPLFPPNTCVCTIEDVHGVLRKNYIYVRQIMLQRRYKLTDNTTKFVAQCFLNLREVLQFKLDCIGACALMGYRSEATITDDNELNLILTGMVMQPHPYSSALTPSTHSPPNTTNLDSRMGSHRTSTAQLQPAGNDPAHSSSGRGHSAKDSPPLHPVPVPTVPAPSRLRVVTRGMSPEPEEIFALDGIDHGVVDYSSVKAGGGPAGIGPHPGGGPYPITVSPTTQRATALYEVTYTPRGGEPPHPQPPHSVSVGTGGGVGSGDRQRRNTLPREASSVNWRLIFPSYKPAGSNAPASPIAAPAAAPVGASGSQSGIMALAHTSSSVGQVLPPVMTSGPAASSSSGLIPSTPDVLLTPLCYVPGTTVEKYHGRVSQHFLRETSKMNTDESLGGVGAFTHSVHIEANCIIHRLVAAVGGNALLNYTCHHHVIDDDDDGNSAYQFITITGHAVTLSWPPVYPNFVPPPAASVAVTGNNSSGGATTSASGLPLTAVPQQTHSATRSPL